MVLSSKLKLLYLEINLSMTKKIIKNKVPKFKDSDSDGLSDYDEINIFGSDPYNSDSNGDGIEDGEAVLNGRDPVTNHKLKDFFVPYAGNNYQPKSLSPKRLLFHAFSVLIVKALLFLLVFFYPVTAWMTPDVLTEESYKIIALTNDLRKKLSLNSLNKNQKLDQAATKKVEDMLINQYFAHLSPQGRDLEYFLKLSSYNSYITVGENLAMGYDNASDLMSAWKNSPTHYNNLIDPNFSEIGVALVAGSYQDIDTVFGAQYFGLPKAIVEKDVIPERADIVFAAAASTISTIVVPEAKIVIDEASGAKSDKVIKVEAVLPTETETAVAEVLNTQIEMFPMEENNWVGQVVIQDNSNIITPPVITLNTNTGEVQRAEISDNNIKPQKSSVASQYFLFKNNPDKNLEKVFGFSSIYFKVLLGFFLIALFLNIFINIKKQHLKSILSGLGLLGLLILMIIF